MNQLKQKIEKVISLAQKWYENNSMKNNIGKSEIMVMSKGNEHENIIVTVNTKSRNELKII